MIKVVILTLFPDYYNYFLKHSILKNAQKKKLIDIDIINYREYSQSINKQVDDTAYGGGAGMVLMCEPIINAIEAIDPKHDYHRIFMSPQGETLNNDKIKLLSQKLKILILVGNYEGIDERVLEFIDEEISIGDFVLTGGELASMVLIDGITRFLPDAIKHESLSNDSFYNKILDHSHFTKPQVFKNLKVPDILVSGDHEKIREWRKFSALKNTYTKRPDLLTKQQIDLYKKNNNK